MTLIQAFQLGSIATIITGDTRRTIGEGVFKIPLPHEEGFSKIRELSPNLFVVGGGLDEITNFICDELIKRDVKYIDSAIVHSKQIERRLKQQLGSTLATRICSQTLIAGITETGMSAYLTYQVKEDDEGTFKKVILEPLQHSVMIFSANDDAQKLQSDAMDDLHIQNAAEIPKEILKRFASVQHAAWQQDSDIVSEIFQYCVIYRDPETGECSSYKGELNLKEMI